jgi:hypothetical protein
MRFSFRITLCFFLGASVLAVSMPHVTTFGKWTAVKSFTDLDQNRSDDLKVRTVHVDGRLKEFTSGIAHEATEQLFVVRRVVRVNDTLLQEATATPRWSWQRGGWLVINRITGHISQASLPEFDPDPSAGIWSRTMAASSQPS